ncbi:hypothetical protein V6N13_068715 [Hibiscus sabdariffa]|uniref:Uncharacterized protein n=1 Tax=Hibiscus sabdariffa TaxID=183260 RepID=A0ABR2QNC6_9ROSI
MMMKKYVEGGFGAPKPKAMIRWVRKLHIEDNSFPFIKEAEKGNNLVEEQVTVRKAILLDTDLARAKLLQWRLMRGQLKIEIDIK